MKLTKEEIIELQKGTTKGPWKFSLEDYGDEWWFGGKYNPEKGEGGEIDVSSEDGSMNFPLQRNDQGLSNAAFIASAPDIAETALAALERVEELEKEHAEAIEGLKQISNLLSSLEGEIRRL